MKTTVNGKEQNANIAPETSKIEAIKNIIFGENINSYNQEFETIKKDILEKKAELLDLIVDTRKELETAVDSLSTDLNIRITELEDKFEEKANDLNSKKLDKKILGELLIKLGTKISD